MTQTNKKITLDYDEYLFLNKTIVDQNEVIEKIMKENNISFYQKTYENIRIYNPTPDMKIGKEFRCYETRLSLPIYRIENFTEGKVLKDLTDEMKIHFEKEVKKIEDVLVKINKHYEFIREQYGEKEEEKQRTNLFNILSKYIITWHK